MEGSFVLLNQNKKSTNKKVIGLALLAVAAIGACAIAFLSTSRET